MPLRPTPQSGVESSGRIKGVYWHLVGGVSSLSAPTPSLPTSTTTRPPTLDKSHYLGFALLVLHLLAYPPHSSSASITNLLDRGRARTQRCRDEIRMGTAGSGAVEG